MGHAPNWIIMMAKQSLKHHTVRFWTKTKKGLSTLTQGSQRTWAKIVVWVNWTQLHYQPSLVALLGLGITLWLLVLEHPRGTCHSSLTLAVISLGLSVNHVLVLATSNKMLSLIHQSLHHIPILHAHLRFAPSSLLLQVNINLILNISRLLLYVLET